MATAITQVRTARPTAVPGLSATFADAFHPDPVMTWCYPDADRRAQILPEAFRVLLEHTIPHGGVETVDGEVSGSIWVPPTAEIDEETMVGEFVEVSGEYAERVLSAFELLGEHHPSEEEHQYLFILGTRDAWQSRGLGSALIRSVTVGCDRDGVGAYLEATSEHNRSLYERHGFQVTEVLHLPDGPPLWCMWRTPGAGPAASTSTTPWRCSRSSPNGEREGGQVPPASSPYEQRSARVTASPGAFRR